MRIHAGYTGIKSTEAHSPSSRLLRCDGHDQGPRLIFAQVVADAPDAVLDDGQAVCRDHGIELLGREAASGQIRLLAPELRHIRSFVPPAFGVLSLAPCRQPSLRSGSISEIELRFLLSLLLIGFVSAPQAQVTDAFSPSAVMVLVDKDGIAVGPVVPMRKKFFYDAAVIVSVNDLSVLVGVLGYREEFRSMRPSSSGYYWSMGTRSFTTLDCSGQPYVSLDSSAVPGGERIAVAYREKERYLLAVAEPTPGNFVERNFRSYLDDGGRCIGVSSSGYSVPVQFTISLDAIGKEPFYLKEMR
jgi:hypothetical protein